MSSLQAAFVNAKQSDFIELLAFSLTQKRSWAQRSAVMAVPAAKEMGPTNRQQSPVFSNGVLRLDTYVNKIRANLYSGINLHDF
jgi:hypothetical protein